MTDLDEIYSPRILEIAAHTTPSPRLASPDVSANAHSKLCGSKIVIDLNFEGCVITDYGHQVEACLLGQTSAAIVAQHIKGSSIAELRALHQTMRQMLQEEGAVPSADSKWADLAILEPVRDFRARHASTLLVFTALEDAFTQYENAKISA